MANDIDMFRDIEVLEKGRERQQLLDLMNCYNARYQEGNLEKAEKLKNAFAKNYGYWGNWY